MSRETELSAQVYRLSEELDQLRLRDERQRSEIDRLERRLAEAREKARATANRGDRLQELLTEARERLVKLREEVESLGLPPNTFGTFLGLVAEGVADVWSQSRKLRVQIAPDLDTAELEPGREVLLNDTMLLVGVLPTTEVGEVLTLKDTLPDGKRAVVVAPGDDETVVRLSEAVLAGPLRPGDSLLVDRKVQMAYERVPKIDVEDLVLEEVPDIGYGDIGGLGTQIEMIRDAVELPFLHRELFADYDLEPPKGILLYGPPGCGKTMIAKAVANSLATSVRDRGQANARSFFFNIKGPELLNKYVGETERQIRLIFQRARERAADGMPVIVFFDEMDSLFRTRGTGVSSDVENTIVPQLLSEIDGVERLANVIIIGASNREDMIDPAILRPGRLDVKIKIERPNEPSARDIIGKYLTDRLPVAEGHTREELIDAVVNDIYAESDENRFLEVTYASGDKEVLFFRDFASGAMLQNIISRAKKMAIKDRLETGRGGISPTHLRQACRDEFSENEDLPNTTNPDDWARISGKKGERIVYVRTLVSTGGSGRTIDTVGNTGQYL
ncbi:proteasome ATPase [Enemella sp. A6]|uniref:proteasome ATPase n=1 Tax=Enemella sp. A6 TaxID=3440152 RepID=UPI003EB79340